MSNRLPINPELTEALRKRIPGISDAEIEIVVHQLEGEIGKRLKNDEELAFIKRKDDGSGELTVYEIDSKN